MTTIKKPEVPALRIAEFKKQLEPVKTALAEGAQSGVDLGRLEGETRAADGRAHPVVDDFRFATGNIFAKKVQAYDGSTGAYWTTEPARVLSPEQVGAAKAIVEYAAKKLDGIQNHDGVVEWNVASAVADDPRSVFGEPANPSEVAGQAIAQSAVRATMAPTTLALMEYQRLVASFRSTVSVRANVDGQLVQNAQAHVKSPLGREAVVWAYREKLAGTTSSVLPELQARDLTEAETSFLSKLPLLGKLAVDHPHLDDREVAALLGVDDLSKFVASTKAKVEQRVGEWGAYLKGRGPQDPVVE